MPAAPPPRDRHDEPGFNPATDFIIPTAFPVEVAPFAVLIEELEGLLDHAVPALPVEQVSAQMQELITLLRRADLPSPHPAKPQQPTPRH